MKISNHQVIKQRDSNTDLVVTLSSPAGVTVRAGLREICVGFCSFCHVFDGPWRRTMACLAAPARRTGHLSPSLLRGTCTILGRPQHICAPPPHVSAVIPHSRLLVVRAICRFALHCEEMGSRNLPQLRGNASSNPNHPRSTILHQPKIFCRSISRRPPFRSSPDPPTRPTSWWTFRVGRRGLGDELRDLPQFGHARQVPSVRRSPPLPPRLARCDPPLSAASLRCSRLCSLATCRAPATPGGHPALT